MCEFCKGTGWVLASKPVVSPLDGKMTMLSFPQICVQCESYSRNMRGTSITLGEEKK